MSTPGHETSQPELLVIGLGTTGKVALDMARASGANAIGLDRRAEPEGALPQERYACRVWGIFPDGTVATSDSAGTTLFVPRATIIATGAIDIPLPLPGWHLNGALGAYQAGRALTSGTPVVVLRGPHALAGARAPSLDRFDILHDEHLAGGETVEIIGAGSVEAVRIGTTTIPASVVLLDNGLQPENGLARMVGIPSTFDVAAGGDAIAPGTVFAVGGSLISVIGDAAGTGTPRDVLQQDASTTASRLATALNGGDIPISIPSDRTDPAGTGMPMLPAQITGDTLVCPDEGITVQDVLDAVRHGATTVNDVKRRTRAGMSVCQGRDCSWTIRAILARHGRRFDIPLTARPPAAGITVGELAVLQPR